MLFLSPFQNKPWFLRVCSINLLKTLWGKGEIAHNEQFLLFPQCFLPFWKIFIHLHQIWNCCLQTLSDWKNLKLIVWERVNHLPQNPKFQQPCKRSLLKRVCKPAFYPFPTLYSFFSEATSNSVWAIFDCHWHNYSICTYLKFCSLFNPLSEDKF